MRKVAEIMYIVEDEREAFLEGALNPDDETKAVLWICGVRNQQYFALNDLIFMTFEYDGADFDADMNKMASYLDSKGHLVKKRRKDVPLEERTSTSWWAPVKKLGTFLERPPRLIRHDTDDSLQTSYMAMLDGCMDELDEHNDIAYDEEDWMEDVQIWNS